MGKLIDIAKAVEEFNLNKGELIKAISSGRLDAFVDTDALLDGLVRRKSKNGRPVTPPPDGCITSTEAAKLYGISRSAVYRYKAKGILQGVIGQDAIFCGQEHPRITIKKRRGVNRPELESTGSLNSRLNHHVIDPKGPA